MDITQLIMIMGAGGGGGGSSAFTSIQHVELTMSGANTTVDATISSVSTSLSSVMWGGIAPSDDTQTDDHMAYVELINSTTVRATRVGNDSGQSFTIRCTVVEWHTDWIQSIQRGTIDIVNPSTSNTATISNITTANAYVSFLGYKHSRTSSISTLLYPVIELTDATTVTATMGQAPGTSTTLTVSYEVVEFKSAKVTSIQEATLTGSSTGATQNVTISSVTPSDCMVIPRGFYHLTSSASRTHWSWALTSSTNVEFRNGISTSNARKVGVTVVELSGTFSAVANIEDTTGYVTSASTANVTITSVDTTKSFLTYGGCNTATNNSAAEILSACKYTSGTNVEFTRGNTVTLTTQYIKARTHTFS